MRYNFRQRISARYRIYKLLFPGGEMYFGKTVQLEDARWKGNGCYGYTKTSRVGQAILKYGWENVQIIILYEGLKYDEVNRLEKEIIQNNGGINNPLILNSASGGDEGYVLSNELKERLSEAHKKTYQENPELMVKVDQYTIDGQYIATYNSIRDAHNATGATESAISSCAKGIYITAGGFKWQIHGKKYPLNIKVRYQRGPRHNS